MDIFNKLTIILTEMKKDFNSVSIRDIQEKNSRNFKFTVNGNANVDESTKEFEFDIFFEYNNLMNNIINFNYSPANNNTDNILVKSKLETLNSDIIKLVERKAFHSDFLESLKVVDAEEVIVENNIDSILESFNINYDKSVENRDKKEITTYKFENRLSPLDFLKLENQISETYSNIEFVNINSNISIISTKELELGKLGKYVR